MGNVNFNLCSPTVINSNSGSEGERGGLSLHEELQDMFEKQREGWIYYFREVFNKIRP